MSVQERIVFELNGWTIDSLAHSLSYGDEDYQVPAKVMAVLVVLAQNHERLVTREELIDVVWDGNSYVGEKALNNAVWRIRQVLGKNADGSEYVKTTPKTGYQLTVVPRFSVFEGTDTQFRKRSSTRLWFVAAVVLLAVALYQFIPREPSPLSTGESLAMVTNLPGRELYAAPSPNGKMFAFLHVSQRGTQDLYVQSLEEAGAEAIRFSSDDASNFGPTWAADSQHLAYIRVDDVTDLCEVVVRDLAEDSEEVIDQCVDIGYPTLSWSPDGRWLVYRKDDPDVGPGLYLKAMNHKFQPVAELSDRRISCFDCTLFDQEVSWSPDSKHLAVTRLKNRMSTNVYRFDIDLWNFKQLTRGEISIKGHTWSKNGKNILYVSNKHPLNRRIWSIDSETGESQEIGYQGAGFPVYLPSYESILFYRRRVTTYISAIELDRSSGASMFPVPIIQTSGSERNPDYSGIADRLAYYSNVSGHNEIWTASPDGSNRKQLTNLQTSAVDPRWSPDGRQIAFIALDANTESTVVNVFDVQGGSIRTVTTGFGDHGAPNWARDGMSLIVPIWQGQEVDLWRVTLDGNQLTRLTSVGAEYGRVSPDGSLLYYTKLSERGLFKMPVEGGPETQVIADMVWSGIGNWTWAGADSIIYARRYNDLSELVELHETSGETRVLLRHPGRTIHRYGMLGYSQQHDALFFTHREPQQIDILMAPDPLAGRN